MVTTRSIGAGSLGPFPLSPSLSGQCHSLKAPSPCPPSLSGAGERDLIGFSSLCLPLWGRCHAVTEGVAPKANNTAFRDGERDLIGLSSPRLPLWGRCHAVTEGVARKDLRKNKCVCAKKSLKSPPLGGDVAVRRQRGEYAPTRRSAHPPPKGEGFGRRNPVPTPENISIRDAPRRAASGRQYQKAERQKRFFHHRRASRLTDCQSMEIPSVK